MTHSPQKLPTDDLARMRRESLQRTSDLHRQVLQMRLRSLQNVKTLIELQMRSSMPAATKLLSPRPALFDSRQLDEFGTGRISNCLGPAFARYDTRCIPRIPNGDLKMISRITAISGTPRNFTQPASVTAEYDVPENAWYFRDQAAPDIPGSLWMEMALQPCGFLSAYLDSYALLPYQDFFFRNLDGHARFGEWMDVRGKTITTRARLISSVASSGTVIQKYGFELECAGRTVYQGESLFGYFSPEAMANQAGLDGGQPAAPWLGSAAGALQPVEVVDLHPWCVPAAGRPFFRLASGRLQFLDKVSIVRRGGRYGEGYIYASKPVNPRDWFYPYHFFQDPVMPGSLGVEAILEAMRAYALAADLGNGFRAPRFGQVGELPVSWRYRGQITPQNRLMELDVHLTGVQRAGDHLVLAGDANLWVDGLRIYEIQNATIGIQEG